MIEKQPEPSETKQLPPWAAELPISLNDLADFIRRWKIRGARVLVTDRGLELAYESWGEVATNG